MDNYTFTFWTTSDGTKMVEIHDESDYADHVLNIEANMIEAFIVALKMAHIKEYN